MKQYMTHKQLDGISEKLIEDKDLKFYASKVSENFNIRIEQYVKIHLKPKPIWMPKSVYEWLLKNLLEIHHFK